MQQAVQASSCAWTAYTIFYTFVQKTVSCKFVCEQRRSEAIKIAKSFIEETVKGLGVVDVSLDAATVLNAEVALTQYFPSVMDF